MYMGMSERSETMGLLHLKFSRQSNFPEIQIEGCLGGAIVVLTDVTEHVLLEAHRDDVVEANNVLLEAHRTPRSAQEGCRQIS